MDNARTCRKRNAVAPSLKSTHSPAHSNKYYCSNKTINKTAPPFPSSRIQHYFQTITHPSHQSQYSHSTQHNTSLISSIIVFRNGQLRSHTFPTDAYPNSWDSWVLKQMTRNIAHHSFHVVNRKTTHQQKSPSFLAVHGIHYFFHLSVWIASP